MVQLTKGVSKFTKKGFMRWTPEAKPITSYDCNLGIFIISLDVCPWKAFPAYSDVWG
jgi:hypothetical protein